MSSRGRVRSRGGGYLNSRGSLRASRESDYKMSSNFPSKSRDEKHSEDRRRDNRSIDKRRDDSSRKSDQHRESSKSNGRHKESFSSVRENRESFLLSKDNRESYSSRGGRESYSNRDEESFSSRESFPSRGGRDSYNVRGRESFPSRGGRVSYSSRGNYESFSSRGGRISFSSRGSHDSFNTRGGRETFIPRGGREQFSTRGGRENYSSRGRDSYLSRGREAYASRGGRETFSQRGGREFFSSRGFGRGMFRGSLRGTRSVNSYGIGHRTQLEMTKKLVASVLKNDEMDERHSFRNEKSHSFRGIDIKETRQYFNEDVERRPFKDPRSWSHDERSLKREGGSTRFKSDQLYASKMDKYRAIRKRAAEIDDESDPSSKRQRLNDVGRFRGLMQKRFFENSFDKREFSHESDDEAVASKKPQREKSKGCNDDTDLKAKVSKRRTSSTSKLSRERSRSGSAIKQEVKEKRKRRESEKEKKISIAKDAKVYEEADKSKVVGEESQKQSKRKFSVEEMESADDNKESSPGGMQVTIRSDGGERAVNNDGHVKSRLSSGKIFVDLHCPHCPGHNSVTFQEYRYHLDTKRHNNILRDLTYKHSIVLRKIRLQQRNEQREIEEKWEKDEPEAFASSVSRYCRTCKLAFKVNGDDNVKGYAEHNNSKLHKVQRSYLFPRCFMCRMSFPSRLIYEYHVASIRHLRMKTIQKEKKLNKDGLDQDDDDNEDDDFETEEDLTNFVTMDSVGEDEDIGSLHDELTGNLEELEAAEQEAKDDDEEDEEFDGDEGEPLRRTVLGDEDPIEMDLTNESENHEDVKDNIEVLGKEYICAIEASYCKLCNKVIRTDSTIGFDAINQHCSSNFHLENYHYLQSEDFMDEHGEGFEVANRLEEEYMAEECAPEEDEDEIEEEANNERDISEGKSKIEEELSKSVDFDDLQDPSKAPELNVSKEKEISEEEVKVKDCKSSKEENKKNSPEAPCETDEIEPEKLFEEVGEQLEDDAEMKIQIENSNIKEIKTTKTSSDVPPKNDKQPQRLTRRKTSTPKFNGKASK